MYCYKIFVTYETVKLRDGRLARCLTDVPDFDTTLHKSTDTLVTSSKATADHCTLHSTVLLALDKKQSHCIQQNCLQETDNERLRQQILLPITTEAVDWHQKSNTKKKLYSTKSYCLHKIPGRNMEFCKLHFVVN